MIDASDRTPAESAVEHDYSAIQITEEERRKLLTTGHGSRISIALPTVVDVMKRADI